MKIDIKKLNLDIKHYEKIIMKLENNNESLESIELNYRILNYMIFLKNSFKTKKRPVKIKYSKSLSKQKLLSKELEKLLYNNHNLSNKELIFKLKISKANFYKNYHILTKELKEKYKSQSLF